VESVSDPYMVKMGVYLVLEGLVGGGEAGPEVPEKLTHGGVALLQLQLQVVTHHLCNQQHSPSTLTYHSIH